MFRDITAITLCAAEKLAASLDLHPISVSGIVGTGDGILYAGEMEDLCAVGEEVMEKNFNNA